MQVGFAIDHRKCIGCHACTVACKSENEVPLGSFRTWVKYVEKGAFPDVRRHFTVLRCNHCDRAPCVTICPVNALHKRPDAIVDLDRDLCIGCRACMQACPYDALYFNTERGVAEKCHYCAHRVDRGLEPACVSVCPAEAIVAGDANDPSSDLARLLAEQPTAQRKLGKGTEPRVWYIEALPEALVPGTAAEPASYLWSERPGLPPPPEPEAARDVVTTLDVAHPPAWGWHVWLYLLTKNIAAGAALVAPFLGWLGVRAGRGRDWLPESVALLFLGVTLVLLVHDLGRPERFWRLLLRPNSRSWLVRGAWVLTAFGLVAAGGLVARGLGHIRTAEAARWLNVPLGVLASGYSAWLFAQCRGRDLWLERGLFFRLVGRAALCGAGLAVLLPRAPAAPAYAAALFTALAAASALLLWADLRSRPHVPDARRAHAVLVPLLSRWRVPFAMAIAALVAAAPAALGSFGVLWVAPAGFVAVILALAALLLYERAWIHAGQRLPLS
jgi:Fe-S-cluster-containing dehydrogenase component/formate-dependent nitrite reductase membrane component NrfD